MDNQDFNIPNNLNAQGQQAAEAIVALMTAELTTPSGGGCKAFCTPEEWADRGEDYGQGAVLIVVHDGGDQARYFNLDYCQYEAHDRMHTCLEKLGLFAEQCTCWYSAVYAAR
jgi:hypothetical protein